MIEDLSTISSVSERHFDFNIFSIYPPRAFFSTERQFNIIIILSFLSDRHLGAYGCGQHGKRVGQLVGFIQHYGLMELGCKCAWYIIKNAILFNTGYRESLLGLLLDVFLSNSLGYVHFLFQTSLFYPVVEAGGDIPTDTLNLKTQA